ncbi:MAG: hypothetical protein QS99_C0015G0027 [archaeon GW2011_AR4]|nr:MAG: hypothetical protein QS99_C0015G0027 [archaeon GW2011_AR4]
MGKSEVGIVKRGWLLLVLLVLLSAYASAQNAEVVISNSKDWKDVYSVMQYGYLAQKVPAFIVSDRHAPVILNQWDPAAFTIEAISSKSRPQVIGYKSIIEGNGFTAKETVSDQITIDLAARLTDINQYVIVDPLYGYNAIAVAPYAIVSRSFVLFADQDTIADVDRFLSSQNPEHVLIYGHVDREVMERLSKYDPETINEDGDRFANNVAIVKKYKEINDAKQVLLTNGEVVEAEIMSGSQPVLFIGVENVPDKIKEYIKNSNIAVGVLVGNNLVGTATTVRRQTGISTFVKFARNAREPSGPVAQIEGLDIFYLPKVPFNLQISKIRYNKITRQIEVTYTNPEGVAVFFKATFTVRSENGEEQVMGDVDPLFIEGNSEKTVVYPVDPFTGEALSTDIFVIFGEARYSLERVLSGTMDVEIVSVTDESQLQIEKILLDRKNNLFLVYLKNIGEVDTYAQTEVHDVFLLGERRIFGAQDIVKIPPGQTGISKIPTEVFGDEDITNNPTIKVRTYFGEREDALVKVIEGQLDLRIKGFDIIDYAPHIIILLLILLIIGAMRKKKCEHCGHKNPRKRKICKNCHNKL